MTASTTDVDCPATVIDRVDGSDLIQPGIRARAAVLDSTPGCAAGATVAACLMPV
ncbi:hypothetical protein FAIPA1_230031 [Frankia sp. AiPs1]|uniref:hypothetical protein n=1 Tax=Frankia sp. AiPa1 TaxID=573492 RepID=UPI00202B5B09|nr:hypothetical protein [Frankia sp. AiPa1]MCL9758738.1 hypothetical protein [Frankia sp. AiPa1]